MVAIIPFKALGLCFLGLISVVTAGYVIGVYAPGGYQDTTPLVYEVEENNTPEPLLSEKELFDAINEQRKGYSILPLRTEGSTCALARARVEEVYEKGTEIYGVSSSFQRITDKVLEENDFSLSKTPDYYFEFLTYEETVEDAMREWSQNDGSEIFINGNFRVGCAAEKEGFAIVVVGLYKHKKDLIEDKTEYETSSSLEGLEKDIAEVI